jgi:predicted acyltransferase
MQEDRSATAAPRLAALDTFRGLAVAGMIVVNTPGSGEHVWPRIGLCYAAAAILAITTARRDADGRAQLNATAILAAATGALVLYWALLSLVPVPEYGVGQLTPEGNLAGYVDRTLFTTKHIWRFGTDAAGNVVYDPEGLLSTIPALANVLFGILAAIAWRHAPDRSVRWIAIAGVVLVLLGLAFAPIIPINKRLWTSSFALLTTGLSAMLFTLCILALRSPALARILKPFDIFGMNAILGYILSLLIGLAGMRLGFQARCFEAIRAVVADPYLASFLYSLAVTGIVLAALVPLHRRGMHLRL